MYIYIAIGTRGTEIHPPRRRHKLSLAPSLDFESFILCSRSSWRFNKWRPLTSCFHLFQTTWPLPTHIYYSVNSGQLHCDVWMRPAKSLCSRHLQYTAVDLYLILHGAGVCCCSMLMCQLWTPVGSYLEVPYTLFFICGLTC